MTNVDRVVQMYQQGMSDSEIAFELKNEGASMKDISDLISQARIKMAVSQEEVGSSMYDNQGQYADQGYQDQSYQGQYQDQSYQGQYMDQGYQGQGVGIETITEIIDRILSEKLREVNQNIKSISDFKNKAEDSISDLKERIKRIESTIDSLQKSIIGKIGEFGQSSAMIHNDLNNLHDSVSKLMNPLIDNYNELKEYNSKNN